MKLAKALAPLALLTLAAVATVPAYAAKEAKIPRCTGKAKRPANPYGTVLPTLPARGMQEAGTMAPPTNLFPSSAGSEGATPDDARVPPISAAVHQPQKGTGDQPVYASC